MRGLGGAAAHQALLAVPNVTAHPSTASIPITVFLYNGPLFCGFNVPFKGLKTQYCIVSYRKGRVCVEFVYLYIGIYTPCSVFSFNPLGRIGNYSAASNNVKLVYTGRWPVEWAGPHPAHTPPRCTKCNSPPVNGQCTNHRIMVRCSAVLMFP